MRSAKKAKISYFFKHRGKLKYFELLKYKSTKTIHDAKGIKIWLFSFSTISIGNILFFKALRI